MLANRASSTPPTTAASSDQIMQDGAGRFWTSLGQSPGLQMAWRRLPVFRSEAFARIWEHRGSRFETKCWFKIFVLTQPIIAFDSAEGGNRKFRFREIQVWSNFHLQGVVK